MAIDSVGYYALPVIPSLRGAEKKINAELRGVFGGAAVGNAGKAAGKKMGDGIADGLRSAETKTRQAADRHAKALDKVADAGGKTRVAIRQLNEVLNQGASGSRLDAASERVAKALRDEATAARSAQRAEMELGNARRSQAAAGFGASLGNPLRGAEQGMKSSSGGLAALAGGIGSKVGGAFMGGMAAIAGAGAIAGFFKSAISTGIDFERTVNAFSGVTASGAEGMNKMRMAARALGEDTHLAGVTARDAGNAMLELAKGGMTAQQAIDAARGTLQLATAGQIDAAQAAAIQSAAINTFSLKAGDATHVADLLAAAANASSADVSDLGLALRQGGSVAAGFGVSIEDTLTALTMFSRMGINGSDAGTMLKTSLLSITDQGKPAQEAIHALGLSLYDAQGNFVGVESMMKQVAEASKRMTAEEFQANAATLFGSDAMRASMVAAKGGAAAWDDAAKAVNRQGAAADMAGAQMQGLPGVVEALSNVWEGFKLKLFDVIDGPLISIGNWFTNVLSGDGPQWIKDYGDNFKAVFSGIAGAVGPVKDALAGVGEMFRKYIGPALTEYIGKLKGPLTDLGRQIGAAFKEAAPILKVVGIAIGGALLGGLKALGFVMPIVIRGVTMGVKALQLFYQGVKGGAGVLVEVGQFLGGVFVGAWHLLQGAVSAAWSVLEPVWDGFKAALGVLGDVGKYVFDTVLVPVWHDLQLAATGAWAVLEPIWDGFKVGLSAVGEAATWLWQNAIVPAWDGITTAVGGAWDFLSGVFEQLKRGFKAVADFIGGVWDGIAGTVKGALDAVINAVKGPLHWLGGVLQRVPTSIGPVEIPGAQMARDLGNTLAGLAGGGIAGRTAAGRLWGPGTGTSDSILGVDAGGRPTALVSAGEGVVTASSMAQGGAPVVAALNAGWTPSPEFLHGMLPGYRRGGVVAEAERFAASVGDDRPYAYGGTGPGYDCSGFMSSIYAVLTGQDPRKRYFTTESDFEALGFRRGSMRGAFNIGVHRGGGGQLSHMAGTLPNGVNVESGGAHNSTLYGGGAAGADDPQFELHYYLPVGGGDPGGSIAGGALAGLGYGTGSGIAGGGGGSTFLGYEPASPKQMREAQERVADADDRVARAEARVHEQEQRIAELGPKAKESERMTAQRRLEDAKTALEKAKREQADAQSDLEDTKQGKAKYGRAGGGQGGGQGGDDIGSIFSSFLKDTFGLGDFLPDPAELGIVKLAGALLGIKFNPSAAGGDGASMLYGGGADPTLGGAMDPAPGGSGLPFGMVPGVSSRLPNIAGPATAPADAAPAGAAGPIDQSTHVTIHNPQGDEQSIADRTRRVILKTPRLGTYAPPGVGP